MRYLLHVVVTVIVLVTLSACQSFEEMRPEICPTCTDAQWQVKVEERKAQIAKIRKESQASSSEFQAQQAFFDQYPRCFKEYNLQMQTLGVRSPQFLELCEEYGIQIGSVDDPNKDVPNDGISNPIIRTNAPVKRWDNKGGPKTWLTAQSPLWPCRDRKRWNVPTCISDANTAGRSFKITAVLERYVKPKKSFTKELTDALTPSLNPFDWVKKVVGACKPINTPGGMLGGGSRGADGKMDGGLKLLNIGLMGCGALGSLFGGGKNETKIFQGLLIIKLNEEAIHKCPQFITGYYTKGTAVPKYNLDHIDCFSQVLRNAEKRDALFARTGIRPDNKFGPAGSFSILESCANKKNWAAYGRDATSEEVAFCKTRNTIQDGKAYQLEARQLNFKDGNQWIKITIGRQVVGRLDLDANTRIRKVVMDYRCGNKSFARMRKDPRGTAAACIKDMLALIRAPRNNLDAFVQHQADRMERLGGYGQTPGR